MKRKALLTGIILCVGLMGCKPQAHVQMATFAPTFTQTQPLPATATTTLAATPTATLAPSPTATITLAPSITPTLSDKYPTPPTLMLHPATTQFDSVAFLQAFIELAKAAQIEAVTYQDLTREPQRCAYTPQQCIIFTIDDVQTITPIQDSVQQMINLLQAAGYKAVLGVVTAGAGIDQQSAQTLKSLAEAGWEIATHTENHLNLHDLETSDPGMVYYEIFNSLNEIEAITGIRPVTLILPFGQMVDNPRYIIKNEVRWVVGIVGGKSYAINGSYHYVGRTGPEGDAQTTFNLMFGD